MCQGLLSSTCIEHCCVWWLQRCLLSSHLVRTQPAQVHATSSCTRSGCWRELTRWSMMSVWPQTDSEQLHNLYGCDSGDKLFCVRVAPSQFLAIRVSSEFEAMQKLRLGFTKMQIIQIMQIIFSLQKKPLYSFCSIVALSFWSGVRFAK